MYMWVERDVTVRLKFSYLCFTESWIEPTSSPKTTLKEKAPDLAEFQVSKLSDVTPNGTIRYEQGSI